MQIDVKAAWAAFWLSMLRNNSFRFFYFNCCLIKTRKRDNKCFPFSALTYRSVGKGSTL